MGTFVYLVGRNTKLFFKDKGTFFTALIAPLILLLLFITFLGNVYRESFHGAIPEGMIFPDTMIEGFVGGFLLSSLLAVSCVTVAFCANMIMVQDKVTGARADLTIAPIKQWILALSYYVSTAFVTLIINFVATGVGLFYLSQVGWYLTSTDVLCIFLDVTLLVLFGTAISSVVCYFLKSQGGISAVGTIVSSCYGFLCGAYMPVSQFSKGIQKLISFLPGTYGTGLLRNHFLNGVLEKMEADYFPSEVVKGMGDSFDCNLYFMEKQVEINQMYLILAGTVGVLILIYVVMNITKKKAK